MMRKKCVFLCFFVFFCEAANLNGIAIIVDKEPITLYEIDEAMKELKTNKNNAIDFLINDRIEQAQIKKMGALISDFELEDEVKKILLQNKTKSNQLNAQSYENLKKNLKKQLEKRKLYEAVASSAKIDYSEDGARNFYERNINEFLLYRQINVSIYSSNTALSLENLRNTNKKDKNIQERNAILNLENADPRLMVFLSRIGANGYSPVLENGDKFILYKVKSKTSPQTLAYEEIKDEISSVYINKQRQDYIKDFFDKAHSKANITRLR